MHQAGNDSRSAGLMVCTQPGSVVAMEVFEELQVVAPVLVLLKLLSSAVHGTMAVFVFEEDVSQPASDLLRHLKHGRQRNGTEIGVECLDCGRLESV